MSYTCTVPATK